MAAGSARAPLTIVSINEPSTPPLELYLEQTFDEKNIHWILLKDDHTMTDSGEAEQLIFSNASEKVSAFLTLLIVT